MAVLIILAMVIPNEADVHRRKGSPSASAKLSIYKVGLKHRRDPAPSTTYRLTFVFTSISKSAGVFQESRKLPKFSSEMSVAHPSSNWPFTLRLQDFSIARRTQKSSTQQACPRLNHLPHSGQVAGETLDIGGAILKESDCLERSCALSMNPD